MNSKEFVALAMPIAQRLANQSVQERGTDNLLVWILALRLAERLESATYVVSKPENRESFERDMHMLAHVVESLELTAFAMGSRGPGGERVQVFERPASGDKPS